MGVDNVYNKLMTDPMMSKTFELGNQEHFNTNNSFNKTDVQFTYLVPTDQAWEDLKSGDFASAYKILFMGDFYYQTHHILERHLKVGAKMSLKQMLDNSKDGKDFDVMRGPSLKIFTKEENGGIQSKQINSALDRHNRHTLHAHIRTINIKYFRNDDI